MRTVLMAYDGSDSSKRALQYLVDFAKDNQGPLQVHVLNVQQEPLLFGEYVTGDMIDELTRSLMTKGDQVSEEAIARLRSAGINAEAHAALGNVPERVRDAVAQLGCDTVVMGTRGLSSFTGLLLGSVATRVIHEVPVPVLLVK
ncbi:universal stress protein [Stutzerimonas tarimensis]|uniref:Universal stress protein n=1 Tax=Stutzerimonas tarimensis TaxID=1507735 RepID=A0ABV7T022_9GAMM